jgi:hypothetical protein
MAINGSLEWDLSTTAHRFYYDLLLVEHYGDRKGISQSIRIIH